MNEDDDRTGDEANGAIQLFADDHGIAVIGEPKAVERFIAKEGLAARELDLSRLRTVGSVGGSVIDSASSAFAESSRWVKLTKESAGLRKTYGLMPTKTTGISHAMIGDPGKIQRWLQIEGGLAKQLTNPAILSGAAGIMAQLAMESATQEITDYLATIDKKVDDILRAQKDAALSKMIGAGLIIDEAMTIREHVGRVNEVNWSKVQGTTLAIAETQGYAVRQLEALADKIEEAGRINELKKIALDAQGEVQEWLAVLARTFQLQDANAILELDRVFETTPSELDEHRMGLETSRKSHRSLIETTTAVLLERMQLAADRANSKVLFNPLESPAIIAAANTVTSDIVVFRDRLGFDSESDEFAGRAWTEAVSDVKDQALETGAKGVETARRFGSRSLGRLAKATSRFAERMAERAEPGPEDERPELADPSNEVD